MNTFQNFKALGRLKLGKRNSMELAYERNLELLRLSGEILWYKFEAIKLRLADNTFYTPDFVVMLKDGQIQIHEVKGFWMDDARVKIKVAAEIFPFQFIGVKRAEGQWKFEKF